MCLKLSRGAGIAVKRTEAPQLSGVSILLGAMGLSSPPPLPYLTQTPV